VVNYTIKNSSGLHARPAAAFCAEAKKFDSEIEVKVLGKSYNAKSLLTIMSAGIENNDKIIITAIGSDAKLAEEALVKVLDKQIN